MQIYVRSPVGGSSIAIDLDPSAPDAVSALQRAIAKRTDWDVAALRLSAHGRELRDGDALDFLRAGSTIDANARLRGGAPKKRCSFKITPTEPCSNPALNIVGDCSKCEAKFCGRHRLPEDHACPQMETFRQSAFLENKAKLEKEAASAGANLHRV